MSKNVTNKILMGLLILAGILIYMVLFHGLLTPVEKPLSNQKKETLNQDIIKDSEEYKVVNNINLFFNEVENNKEYDTIIPILMYHHISESPEEWNDSTISPMRFKEDMLYLKVLGYNTIDFKDYIKFKEEKKPLPANPIIITFDDGYFSNYKYAYPILKELNMKATISIIGWSVGRDHHKDGITPIKKHFNWEQAKEMYDSGVIEIQHHTYDLHNIMGNDTYGKGVDKMDNESMEEYTTRFTKDTLKLKEKIEEEIGNQVIVFTYPFGIYNDITENIIKEMGFKVSLTVEDGVSDFSKGLNLLKRINMTHYQSSVELMKKILKLDGRSIEVPFEDIDGQEDRIRKLEELINPDNEWGKFKEM